jgi:hypothetical protein
VLVLPNCSIDLGRQLPVELSQLCEQILASQDLVRERSRDDILQLPAAGCVAVLLHILHGRRRSQEDGKTVTTLYIAISPNAQRLFPRRSTVFVASDVALPDGG